MEPRLRVHFTVVGVRDPDERSPVWRPLVRRARPALGRHLRRRPTGGSSVVRSVHCDPGGPSTSPRIRKVHAGPYRSPRYRASVRREGASGDASGEQQPDTRLGQDSGEVFPEDGSPVQDGGRPREARRGPGRRRYQVRVRRLNQQARTTESEEDSAVGRPDLGAPALTLGRDADQVRGGVRPERPECPQSNGESPASQRQKVNWSRAQGSRTGKISFSTRVLDRVGRCPMIRVAFPCLAPGRVDEVESRSAPVEPGTAGLTGPGRDPARPAAGVPPRSGGVRASRGR